VSPPRRRPRRRLQALSRPSSNRTRRSSSCGWIRARPELEDVLEAFKSVCRAFGIVARRADDVQHEERITDVILTHIQKAEFLIADLTGERPNVFYEVGYAHAIGKRPILYRKEGSAIPFDLSVHNVLAYRNIKHLKELLTRRLQAITGRVVEEASTQA
jgi:nucleoside 2-deoxyribosyltransferase